MADDLLGISEVAALLAISRQRVDVLTRDKDSGFPEPAEVIKQGLTHVRRWKRSEVTSWAKKTGRIM
jgi:predicted DNA-binding transcriptional regulator AlpA